MNKDVNMAELHMRLREMIARSLGSLPPHFQPSSASFGVHAIKFTVQFH